MHLEFCILIPVFQVDNTEGLNFEAPDDRFPAYCGNTNEISACFKGYFRVNTFESILTPPLRPIQVIAGLRSGPSSACAKMGTVIPTG